MKTANIVILVVGFILIIIVLLVIAYFAYKSLFGPKPLNPPPAGGIISLSCILPNNGNYYYYQLFDASNGDCNFQSINLTTDYNSANTSFKVLHDATDSTKFSLSTNDGHYLFLTSDSNYTDYITWSPTNAGANTNNIWFRMTAGDFDNIYLQTADGRNLGFVAINQSQSVCYEGAQVGNNKFILAVNTTSPQQFYIPAKPASSNIPFTDNSQIVIRSGGNNLVANCASVANARFSPAIQNNQWTVKLSSDKRAFALSFNNNYLKPSSDGSGLLYFYSTLPQLSDYDAGDFSNWFVIKNNCLVSLSTNAALRYTTDGFLNCQNNPYYSTLGAPVNNGSPITI